MAVFVEVDGRRVIAAIRDTEAFLGNADKLYPIISRTVRDYVRQTITMQGRGGKWAPLAKSTRDKIGHRKALLSWRRRIIATWNSEQAAIMFHPEPHNYTVRQHARGWTIPARVPVRGQAMKWSLSGGGVVFAKSAKSARVPARSIYPSAQEVSALISPVVNDWINTHVRTTWR